MFIEKNVWFLQILLWKVIFLTQFDFCDCKQLKTLLKTFGANTALLCIKNEAPVASSYLIILKKIQLGHLI